MEFCIKVTASLGGSKNFNILLAQQSQRPVSKIAYLGFIEIMLCTQFFMIYMQSGHNMKDTVSVLGREEGYTLKYGLRPREIQRARAIIYRISQLEF